MMRPNDQHRAHWRYPLLIIVTMIGIGGCSSTPEQPAHVVDIGRYPDGAGYFDEGFGKGSLDEDVRRARLDLVNVAARQIGTPYIYGGNTRRGFDCSGLVQFAHAHIGVRVPRTTKAQWADSRPQRARQLLPGDLVFFRIDRDRRHVGIYEGGGVFIHAPSSGKRVSRASLNNPYWRQRMLGARTFL